MMGGHIKMETKIIYMKFCFGQTKTPDYIHDIWVGCCLKLKELAYISNHALIPTDDDPRSSPGSYYSCTPHSQQQTTLSQLMNTDYKRMGSSCLNKECSNKGPSIIVNIFSMYLWCEMEKGRICMSLTSYPCCQFWKLNCNLKLSGSSKIINVFTYNQRVHVRGRESQI